MTLSFSGNRTRPGEERQAYNRLYSWLVDAGVIYGRGQLEELWAAAIIRSHWIRAVKVDRRVPSFGYTAERRATDLHDFLQPFSNVLLIGWSLGAIESLQYVDMFGSQRLAGLVLVDSSVGEEPAPPSGGGFVRAFAIIETRRLKNSFMRSLANRGRRERSNRWYRAQNT